jgi:histidinol-phosphate aminotransferase
MEEIAGKVTSALLTQYPITDDLYAALGQHLSISEDHLLLTAGSDAAFKAFFQAYLEPGSSVVTLDPTYAMYDVYAQMFQARVRKVGFVRDMSLDLDALDSAITPGVRLVIIANPNQPTGTVLDENNLLRLAAKAATVGALLVIDEAYASFAGISMLPHITALSNLALTRTFSKAHGMAGLRLGFVCANPHIISNLFKVRSVHDVTSMAVECALLHLKHPKVVQDYVAEVRDGAAYLDRESRKLGLVPLATSTNFMPIRVAHRCPPATLIDRLFQRGFVVRGPFAAPCMQDCIRVTIGPISVMVPFIQALAETLEASS